MKVIIVNSEDVVFEKVIKGNIPLYFATENKYIKFGDKTFLGIIPNLYKNEVLGINCIKISNNKVEKNYITKHDLTERPHAKEYDIIEIKRILHQNNWWNYDCVTENYFLGKLEFFFKNIKEI